MGATSVKSAKCSKVQSVVEGKAMARGGGVDLECDRTWGRWQDAIE